MVALSVILFPPLLIAFLLVMERVEEPLRRPASQREVGEFLETATPAEVETLASSGIRAGPVPLAPPPPHPGHHQPPDGLRPPHPVSGRTRPEEGRPLPTDRVTRGTAP